MLSFSTSSPVRPCPESRRERVSRRRKIEASALKGGLKAQFVVLNNMDTVIHWRAASRLRKLVVRTGALDQREYILCSIQTSSSSPVAPHVLSVSPTCMLSRSSPCDKDGQRNFGR